MNYKVAPLKRFGQNYLTDKNIIQKIIDTFDPKPDDVVIEIGPGTGALTKLITAHIKNFTAVEIDNRVINELKNNFPSINIVNEDFLKLDLNNFYHNGNKIRIIGNIPYNITSPILFKLIDNRLLVKDALIMTQYEVAKRITAGKGTKDYGILSVIINFFADTELCFKISPNVFYPKPKVWSAILKIDFDKQINKEIDTELFIKVVKASFGNRRKTLKNSLSNSIFKNIEFDSLKFPLKQRAEELSIEDFIELTQQIKRLVDG